MVAWRKMVRLARRPYLNPIAYSTVPSVRLRYLCFGWLTSSASWFAIKVLAAGLGVI